jgi:hypothetical protein
MSSDRRFRMKIVSVNFRLDGLKPQHEASGQSQGLTCQIRSTRNR